MTSLIYIKETGVYREFVKKAIEYLKKEYTMHDVNILPWNLYKMYTYLKQNLHKSNQVTKLKFLLKNLNHSTC